MHGSHQLVINSNKLESNSNKSTNSLYLSWYRATFSIVLTTCLSFVCLSAPSAPDIFLTSRKIALFRYCYRGDFENLQSLLNEKLTDLDVNKLGYSSDININIDFNRVCLSQLPYAKSTVLMIAAKRRHLDVVQALLNAGADPNKIDYFNYTPLAQAILSEHLDVVQALLKAGANPSRVIDSD